VENIAAGRPGVKQKLRDRGLSIVEIARRLGVSKSFVSLVISGRQVSPFLQCEIAALVGQTPEELFGELFWQRRPTRRLARRRERGVPA